MNTFRLILFIAFIFLLTGTKGQIFSPYTVPEFPQTCFKVFGNLSLSSDHIPLSFSSHFFSGNFISNSMKEDVLNDLDNMNRFGYENSAGLTVFLKDGIHNKTTRNLRFFAGYQHQTLLYTSFTKDAFQLAMTGNEFTVGNTADISGCTLSYYQFDKIFIGARIRNGMNTKRSLTIAPFVSFHKPYYNLQFGQGSFSTAADTSEITLMLKGSFDLGQSTDKIISSAGGGIDLCYSDSAIIRNYLVHFSVENLGFFYFEGASFRFDGDSLIRLGGLHIEDLSDIDSSMSDYSDSIVSAKWAFRDTTGLYGMLPLKISLVFLNTGFEKFGLHGKLSVHPFLYSLPLFEIIPLYRLNSIFTFGIPLTAGGMGGFHAGLFSHIETKHFNWSIIATSCHNPMNGSQTGFNLQGSLTLHF